MQMNNRSTGYGRSDDVRGDQSDRSVASRSLNVHDLYALKVAVEDDAVSNYASPRNYRLVTNGGHVTPGGRSDVTRGSSDWTPVEWTTGEPRVVNASSNSVSHFYFEGNRFIIEIIFLLI